jgi:hypothetical protein
MKQVISFLLFLNLLFFSCSFPVPQRFRDALACYNGNYTGLDTLINTHGFYTKLILSDNGGLSDRMDGVYQMDTLYYNILFFNDGIFKGGIEERDIPIIDYLDQSATKNGYIAAQFEGIYLVSGDTIKVKCINYSGSINNSWGGREIWYRIYDKNTIIDFYEKPIGLLRSDKNKEVYKPKIYSESNPSKFVYLRNVPDSKSWLKNEKWFYCNGMVKSNN